MGTAYMSLFNKAYAQATGGAFVLRIEDTDRTRYRADSEQQIFETLTWLGLDPDEGPAQGGAYGPYRQSERLDTYTPYVQQLLDAGHAYYCWCTPERLAEMRAEQERSKVPTTGYDRLCLGMTQEQRAALPGYSPTPVVRMLIPDDVPLHFDDLVRGEVSAPRPDDQVILKTDGFPTYHLAVVVDDHLMGITHVVRGEEWISSTPKHLLLYRWLGWDAPAFAHMPLLRNTDKSKISKRKNPAARLLWFREQGYLPEALLNFLQLLGYPPIDETSEVESFADFASHFRWDKVNTVGPVFDLKKLDWLNGHYIRALSPDELTDRILEHLEFVGTNEVPERSVLARAVPLIQERLVLLSEAPEKLRFLSVSDEALVFDRAAVDSLPESAPQALEASRQALADLESWDAEAIQSCLREALVEGLGLKPKFAFSPIRVAVSGSKVSPPLFESMEILGRESCLARLERLQQALS